MTCQIFHAPWPDAHILLGTGLCSECTWRNMELAVVSSRVPSLDVIIGQRIPTPSWGTKTFIIANGSLLAPCVPSSLQTNQTWRFIVLLTRRKGLSSVRIVTTDAMTRKVWCYMVQYIMKMKSPVLNCSGREHYANIVIFAGGKTVFRGGLGL